MANPSTTPDVKPIAHVEDESGTPTVASEATAQEEQPAAAGHEQQQPAAAAEEQQQSAAAGQEPAPTSQLSSATGHEQQHMVPVGPDTTPPTLGPPVPIERINQIAIEVCQKVIGKSILYDHEKTSAWNDAIISQILAMVVNEATALSETKRPTHKFACNSTIVQHPLVSDMVPALCEYTEETMKNDPSLHFSRRGMHSAMGAYWDQYKDGMFTFKYEGDARGMDIVIMLIWISI